VYSESVDVVVVGAGVAGLVALRDLSQAGLSVVCVEARDRIGGRILTVRDALSPMPFELGAEFVHGRSPEIWDVVQAAGLRAYDCVEHAVHLEHGKVQTRADAWDLVDRILSDMQRAARDGPDRSFSEFIAARRYSEQAKALASSYVEGFNAAHPDIIGIASLAGDARAAERIDGDRSFRIAEGYDAVPAHFVRQIDSLEHKLRLNSVVEKIIWKRGQAKAHVRSLLTRGVSELRSPRVVITIPLGVLHADRSSHGAIVFEPEPAATLHAARRLAFGQVLRIVVRFREAFWEKQKGLADVGFLLSSEHFFPTWWTTLPIHAPILVGWSAASHSDGVAGELRQTIVSRAIESLASITGTSANKIGNLLDAAHFHDWSTDPYARGAYSYVPAGAMDARRKLAKPVDDTLYFAGEATNTSGFSATVHGAIESGKRAAAQVLEAVAR